ncbi:MAG: response regulator [Francisellaceae bacterium]
MPLILIVDDEPPIRQMLRLALTRGGFDVIEAADARSAWHLLQKETAIDLILLDWMLPDMSGINLLSRIRNDRLLKNKPVIMLTARAEENNVLRGFDSGSDDYITKPFSPKQLIARINAVLKRSIPEQKNQLIVNDLLLDCDANRVFYNSQEIKCGRLEFKLLQYLMRYNGKTFSRQHLLDSVWSTQKDVTERTVDVHIRRVRKLLEPFGYDKYIRSVRGEGYQMLQNLE